MFQTFIVSAIRGKSRFLRIMGPFRDDLHKHWVQPGMYVETGVFEQHVQFLREHFYVLSFHELLTRWESRDWDDDRRYCVITFDDGWLDNYQNAYPILRKYRIPATIFFAYEFCGYHEWFWPRKYHA